ncbi:wobble nucleotide-excising tRNase [Pacificibacter maritimus]|uniref:Wobble nucleotide-excising tRNase n=1 Tax=Pacificibacter maritimus TaxID=762213 RepID=A0A3N4VE80_9RHOB|nr:AAA family ATPase [Pacificibacter maritimus]RPE72160.1 wobble nucleotide-excising tRNase [Pacificibacter maritimus]
MSTIKAAKPKLRVSAKYIGPIMELEAELSDRPQHLIFARNGTGKSFMARALRLLDPVKNESEDEAEIPSILVSEEAVDHQGTFALFEGNECIGSIGLNAHAGSVNRSKPSYIYHVFSEDFIEAHVRNRLHGLDGNITHEIIVGKENTEIDAKNKDLSELQEEVEKKRTNLVAKFDAGKAKLKSDFNITGSLGSFKQLNSEVYFSENKYVGSENAKDLSGLLKQYNLYKSLPTDPELPQEIEVTGIFPDLAEIGEALHRVTSPSSVAAQFKKRIQHNPNFFQSGLELLKTEDTSCPFCTQGINETALQAIDAYTQFFNDEEAKHTNQLNRIRKQLDQITDIIQQKRSATLKEKLRFNELKKFFSSVSDETSVDLSTLLDQLIETLKCVKAVVETKLTGLGVEVDLPPSNFTMLEAVLTKAVEENAKLYRSISSLVSNSNSERLLIQNGSCAAFTSDFAEKNDAAIQEIRQLNVEVTSLFFEIEILQKTHGDSGSAKARVIETFKLLLRNFFADTYTFDETSFSVRRKDTEIARGPDRTLSDGEKSVIAFCYYIARIHLRVESIEDYKKLFLIVDDPVSSLSFDYIYSIAQCLKYLRLADDGQVLMSLEPQLSRPKMLILTHNNYFYNVISTNNVVKSNGLFQLLAGNPKHQLSNQKAFATPHVLQLRDIYEVSKGNKPPDHTTPNSIRSVIEGMWKFCRPDIQDFEAFVKILISDHKIEIKSVLLNDLCHGGKFSDPPHQEAEIIEAAVEALSVVEKFAEGQLKLCE